jgi:hypothetical protein
MNTGIVSNLIYKNHGLRLVQLDSVILGHAGKVIRPGKLARYIHINWAWEGIILEFIVLELRVFCLIKYFDNSTKREEKIGFIFVIYIRVNYSYFLIIE